MTPATIPVTAGKKTAKTCQKPTLSNGGDPASSAAPPRKNETRERPIAAMMKYCARIAIRAEAMATAATPMVVRTAVAC